MNESGSPRPRHTSLREAHAHLAQHGRAMSMVRLGECRSLDDVMQSIAGAAGSEGAGADSWLLGHGLRVEAWVDPRWPTARQLDAVTGSRPACLWSFDHHALVVNSAALRWLEITGSTPDPDNGRIVRDERTGEPTGIMLEGAAKMVWQQVPEPEREKRKEQIRCALKDLASHGFTEVHDLVSQPWLGPLLAELEQSGDLPMRIVLYPLYPDLEATMSTMHDWQGERIRLGGAKLFADGTLNSRTAWMLHGYTDPLPDLPHGQPMLDGRQFADAMQHLWSLDLGLAVHAIGDGAVRAVLDAAELARIEPRTELPRLRIEHAEVIDEADVPRFANLGVVASVQPCHLLADIEVLKRSLPHRLERVLPLRELIDAGCTPGELLWFGSDTPIVRPHPEDSIQAAVHRRRIEMPIAEGIALQQAITEAEAWSAFAVW